MKANYIEKTVSWQVPKGTYSGTLIDAGIYEQPDQYGSKRKVFRLVFELEHSRSHYLELRVQKRYLLKDGYMEKVSRDLYQWLGKEWFENRINFQWTDLHGLKAKLTVDEVHTIRHRKAYSKVTRIRPRKPRAKK